ncbi:MAG TPA: outer membrane beta-barrel protein [Bacteroidia bacterium]|nr:outer membrane beta-barrel protein [Bacteroidia bacterium]
MKLIRICLLFACFACAVPAVAQKDNGPKNLRSYYDEPWNFGFFLGINRTNFVVTPVNDIAAAAGDSLKTILSKSHTGFDLGIVTELRLMEYATLRFTPEIAFGSRSIEYHFAGVDTFDVTKTVESTWLNFPLCVKVRSKRLNNIAAYMIGGVRYTIDLASQKDARNTIPGQEVIKLYNTDFGFEAGAGLDFFLPYFKFGIELRAGLGMRNLLVRDDTIYSNALDQLRSKVILISFTFEG